MGASLGTEQAKCHRAPAAAPLPQFTTRTELQRDPGVGAASSRRASFGFRPRGRAGCADDAADPRIPAYPGRRSALELWAFRSFGPVRLASQSSLVRRCRLSHSDSRRAQARGYYIQALSGRLATATPPRNTFVLALIFGRARCRARLTDARSQWRGDGTSAFLFSERATGSPIECPLLKEGKAGAASGGSSRVGGRLAQQPCRPVWCGGTSSAARRTSW